MSYDLREALYAVAPGIVVTRAIDDAMAAQYIANGYAPLTSAQILAITGPLPAYPIGLPRFADSNSSPGDHWSIDQRESERG